MKCIHCGEENPAGRKTCIKCGKPLPEETSDSKAIGIALLVIIIVIVVIFGIVSIFEEKGLWGGLLGLLGMGIYSATRNR